MKDKIRVLATVGTYHAVNDGSIAAIPILFPIFKIIFNLSYTQIGIITGGSLLIHLIFQLIIGRVSDGKNSGTMLSLGILLMSTSLLLLTKAQGYYSLLILIFFHRFTASFFHPIGVGWVSRIFKKDRIDWAMGIQSGLADVGGFIAVLTTLYVAENTSWELPLYIWSIAGAVIILVGIGLTSKLKDKHLVVKKISTRLTIKETIEESMAFLKKIKLLIPAFIISGSSWGLIVTYLPLLLVERTNLPLSFVGLIVAIWIGIGSISSIFYGRMSKMLGRKNVIILSYLAIGIGGVALSFFTNIAIIILLMVLLGITVFITFPALFSVVSEITHESVVGKTFGTIFTLQLGGGTLLLFLGGFLSDIYGIWIPFTLLGLITIPFSVALLANRKKLNVSA